MKLDIAKIKVKVFQHIEDLSSELVTAIQDLVRIPSIVGHEGPAQERMERNYRSVGLEVRTCPVNIDRIREHPVYIDTGLSYDGRSNVIGILRGSSENRSIILNGHIDVVTPEPINSWTCDPWGAEIRTGRIYGRGAGDMKSGLMANLFAIRAILDAGFKPRGTVILQSVIEEEAGGSGGTLACLTEGYTADGMICTDGSGFDLTISHAGVSYFRVKVRGRSSHAGEAHLGINTISKMFPVYQALVELDEKRGREVHFPLYEKESTRSCHLNIGTFRAGDWPSTVAGDAEIQGRIGFVPGENIYDIRRLVEQTIHDAARGDAWLRENPPVVEWFGWQTQPWLQDTKHHFIQSLQEAAKDVFGRQREFRGEPAGMDVRYAAYFNMPAAALGPLTYNVHGIDECVDIPSVIELTKFLALVVLRWCGCEEKD
jgi:acetylornithine deacetylase